MATGTGKTYTAFQIIWRLWKAGVRTVDRQVALSVATWTRRWRSIQARCPTVMG